MKRKSINSGLVQTTVPKLFNKMIRKKNITFKQFTNIMSSDVIVISSESESEFSNTDGTTKKSRKKAVKRKLFISENNNAQDTVVQELSNSLVSNEIYTTSTPVKDNKFNDENSSDDTIIQDTQSYMQREECSIDASLFIQKSDELSTHTLGAKSPTATQNTFIQKQNQDLTKIENSPTENCLKKNCLICESKIEIVEENINISIHKCVLQPQCSSVSSRRKIERKELETPTKLISSNQNSSPTSLRKISNQSPNGSPSKTQNLSFMSRSLSSSPNKNFLNNKNPSSSPNKIPIKSPYASPSKQGSPRKPPVHRYLRTINELFETVKKTKYLNDLITSEEPFLKIFTRSGPIISYQFICLKLYTFKHKWYNIFKFCQSINVDIDQEDMLELYTYLKNNNIVYTDYTNESLDYLLGRLSLSEVKEIYTKFRLNNKSFKRKEEMIKTILKYCNSQPTLNPIKSSKTLILNEVQKKMQYSIKAHENYLNAFFNLYHLATFTNPLFWDIGDYFNQIMHQNICFPSYTVQEHPIFYSREQFLDYSKAKKSSYDLENAFTEKQHDEALHISENIFSELKKFQNDNTLEENCKIVPHLKRYTAKAVYISALSHASKPLLAKYPLKVKDWLEYMITNFNSHRKGQWYYHLTWIYMKYITPVDYIQAAELIIEVFQNKDINQSLSEVQLYDLQERAHQLIISNNKYKISKLLCDTLVKLVPDLINTDDFPTVIINASAIRSSELVKRRNYVIQDSDGNRTFMSVENIAIEHYIKEFGFTDGRHCEGRIIDSMFTLFFWDIIYNPDPPVTATFLSKIQQEPLDMRTPYFYLNRKDLIDQRLKDIKSEWTEEKLIEFTKNNHREHSHEAGLCNISNHIPTDELLEVLVMCIGRQTLSKIFERLVQNFSAYVSGMPDLLMWNIEKKSCRFIEVKGEGDKLSTKQKLWIKYLLMIGVEAEVCLVHSTGSKRNYKKEIQANPNSSTPKKKKIEDKTLSSSSSSCKEAVNNEEAFCSKVKPFSKSPKKKKNVEDNSLSSTLLDTAKTMFNEEDLFQTKSNSPKKAKIPSTVSRLKRRKR